MEQGGQTEPETKTQAAPSEWRSKAWQECPRSARIPGINYHGELLLTHHLGNMLYLFQSFLADPSKSYKSLLITVLVQGCIGS